MQNIISIRPPSYGKHQAGAFAHLQQIGIRHVEIDAPPAGQLEQARADLARYGLSAASINGYTSLESPDAAAKLAPALEAAPALGARIVFLSVKAGALPRDVAYARLREIGEAAARHDVTVAVETHPDLAQNGAVALETVQAVDHPNIRINFDPANVHYYNEGVDAVAELRKIAPYVASVHLKDTNGGYRTWHFPALGEGVVDFPAIFRTLNDLGMRGPFTMELEGIQGESLSEEQTQARVAQSLEYLRRIGVA